ncbi:rifin PIR protein,putative [Plasmodium sp. DRC-Itaito]|nr:rifin PIR protein,putative [Plasmodium sp. DRC-Itaito]
MKSYYINIVLFALPLNILANNHKKTSITQYTPTTRLLCECELYAPVNYDNDPQMKSVMDHFNIQTQQRFQEYDNRMKTARQKCKEQCDKECQKIILKDKLEKELMDKFVTLDTNIQRDAIQTCICEKSLADKVEKGCLQCGTNVGVAIPGLGMLGAHGAYELVQAAIDAGIKFATQEGIKRGTQAGIQAAIQGVKEIYNLGSVPRVNFEKLVTVKNFNNINLLGQAVQNVSTTTCQSETLIDTSAFCGFADSKPTIFAKGVAHYAKGVAEKAGQAAEQVTTETTKALTAQKTAEATSATTILSDPIVISFIVVVIIVIILLIIYFILRYRRKKKMKKKLQYIKLLEE